MDAGDAPAARDDRQHSLLEKRLARTERQLVAVVQLDVVRLVEGRQAHVRVSIEVIHRAAVAGVGAIRSQRLRLREHIGGQEGQARGIPLLPPEDERVIVRSSAAIAAVAAGIDVEVLRVGTQGLPHRLGARERRIRVRDAGLARHSRIHARVHQVDRACRPVLPHEAVEDFGIDLIQAEQVGREMPPELRVVAGLHHESARQLPLQVERPRVILRQAARVVGLPVGDAAAIERFRHEERRLRPRRPAGVPVERGAGGECRGGRRCTRR